MDIVVGLTSQGCGYRGFVRIKWARPGAVAQACNPSALRGWDGWITRSRYRDHPGQHGETPSLLRIQKISWAWWCVPVIPATREAEAGELPEPRRRRLQWAEIAPLRSSLGNESETPSQKKKELNELIHVKHVAECLAHRCPQKIFAVAVILLGAVIVTCSHMLLHSFILHCLVNRFWKPKWRKWW